ncbi:DUF4376 domain-containing protein, partial [Catenovulum sediminis]
MQFISNLFQTQTEDGDVVEKQRPQCETQEALIAVINKHYGKKNHLVNLFAQFYINHLQWSVWDEYKAAFAEYEAEKLRIEQENADNIEDPEYQVQAPPVEPELQPVPNLSVEDILAQAPFADVIQQKKKAIRSTEIENIVVVVNGMQFDGDETAQTRMARAIVALDAAGQTETNWKLADNQFALVSKT